MAHKLRRVILSATVIFVLSSLISSVICDSVLSDDAEINTRASDLHTRSVVVPSDPEINSSDKPITSANPVPQVILEKLTEATTSAERLSDNCRDDLIRVVTGIRLNEPWAVKSKSATFVATRK